MNKMFFVPALLAASSALAQDLSQLKDGLYDLLNPSVCAHRVTNDLMNKKIYLQGVSISGKTCGDTIVYKWSHVQGSDYLKTEDVLVNKDLLDSCTAVNGVKPCSPQELLYDENSELVIQLGDILKDGSLLRVLNPNAISLIPTLIHTRNNKTLNSNYDYSREYVLNKVN